MVGDDSGVVRAPEGNGRTRSTTDIVWDSHSRLKAISMSVVAADGTVDIFPRPRTFPLLSSLDIHIRPHIDLSPDIPTILECFQSVPLLRSLHIETGYFSDALSHIVFPWSQLTTLSLTLPIIVYTARDILMQCTALEVASLCDLYFPEDEDEDEDDPPAPATCTLPNLRELDIS